MYLKEAPLHEDVWGIGNVFPRIFNFGTKYRMISFTIWPF